MNQEEGLRRSSRLKTTVTGEVKNREKELSSGSDTNSTGTVIDYFGVGREWSTEAISEVELKPKEMSENRKGDRKDSGRGSVSTPPMSEFMQMFIEEGRRRDDENRRREEEYRRTEENKREDERIRREEEERRREDEKRAQAIESERREEASRLQNTTDRDLKG